MTFIYLSCIYICDQIMCVSNCKPFGNKLVEAISHLFDELPKVTIPNLMVGTFALFLLLPLLTLVLISF